MTPQDVLRAERANLAMLKAVTQVLRDCEFCGRATPHGGDDVDLQCIPCAENRVASMARYPEIDYLGLAPGAEAELQELAEPEEGEPGYRCPSCGELYDSKCRTSADRVCFQCRFSGGD